MIRKNSRQLIKLYEQKSKHSSYQILAKSIYEAIPLPQINVKGKYEGARFRSILSQVSLDGLRVLDIGGNTGYFSFTAIENGAESVDYFEGNNSHAKFVKAAVSALGLESRIKVHNEYFNFSVNENRGRYDLGFCLNVMHHFGDDFGTLQNSISSAKEGMLDCLNRLSDTVDFLVFQMGFNWKGDIQYPLFANGLKQELIDYISSGTCPFWKLVGIEVAQGCRDKIEYKPVNSKNVLRDDQLGEFLNRPMFYMKSRNRRTS